MSYLSFSHFNHACHRMCHLLRRSTCMSSCPSFPLSLLGLSFLFIQIRQVSNMIMRSSGPLKSGAWGIWSFIRVTGNTSIGVLLETTRWRRITFRGSINCLWRRWDGIFGYLTSNEACYLCVGNHTSHNLHTRGWGDMRMKVQPNRDSNPVPPSQWRNQATDWANEAGFMLEFKLLRNRK